MAVHFLPQRTGNQTVSVLRVSLWFSDGVLYSDCRFHQTLNVQQIFSFQDQNMHTVDDFISSCVSVICRVIIFMTCFFLFHGAADR